MDSVPQSHKLQSIASGLHIASNRIAVSENTINANEPQYPYSEVLWPCRSARRKTWFHWVVQQYDWMVPGISWSPAFSRTKDEIEPDCRMSLAASHLKDLICSGAVIPFGSPCTRSLWH